MGGWVGEIKNKANLSPAELPAELELGLSLAKIRSLVSPVQRGLNHHVAILTKDPDTS